MKCVNVPGSNGFLFRKNEQFNFQNFSRISNSINNFCMDRTENIILVNKLNE